MSHPDSGMRKVLVQHANHWLEACCLALPYGMTDNVTNLYTDTHRKQYPYDACMHKPRYAYHL